MKGVLSKSSNGGGLQFGRIYSLRSVNCSGFVWQNGGTDMEMFQQRSSKKYTITKTTMNPRQPPPHLQPA